ncbi:PAPS reductase/FAD synthetase family protein [Aciduliprofundum sp. MAR08-339]|uniref:phosphoadenosine phosphosulfate reductase domain-containing protein n=1 Tax=Aciduliprofundum sp. (strain MAR08-339) TaxID=673860 RepID=UPI0002A4C990|nr:PAPS reductase/FAD synthetase family protein [Aciduliprofundum sp. MAR08-339]
MYKVIWDSTNNGIILTNSNRRDQTITPPRPVFFEELDLLGFNKFWDYPKVQEPLLWAIGRRYYYKGVLVAEAKGGNIFEPPEIVLTEKGQNFKLEPIDVTKVIEKNKESLFVLENEALDFIEHTYKVYKRKRFLFAVAYSGGKDSQVVLDLVTRIIPPDDLVVIFSDTTMEISYTYENVEKTKKEYEKRYPGLKFYTAKPPKPAIEFWSDFGPPSRIHRWCCTVIKTAPFHKLIKDEFINTKNDKFKIIVFEGVRTEESEKRSHYSRIAKNVKHLMTVNARPVLYWNTSEIFLYLFFRNLLLNRGYRTGLSRVGCSVCPFSSEWTEFVLGKLEEDIGGYFSLLKKYAESMGLKEEGQINRYISNGEWKKRSGGRGLNKDSDVRFITDHSSIKSIMLNPKEDFLEWSKTIGEVMYKKGPAGNIYGELKIKNSVIPFELNIKKNKTSITFYDVGSNIDLISKVKKVSYKTAFCIHCGACEIECPTGALNVIPKVKINSGLCTHCGNCINFVEKGCLVAKSVHENIGGVSMKKRTGGIDKYSTFGLREEWLNAFFNFGEEWLEENNLGPKQIPAVLHWLIDAELIYPKSKRTTPLSKYLRKIYTKDSLFVWEIIWNNMYYNSQVIRWYNEQISWGSIITKKDLKEKISLAYPNLSRGTLSNPIDAMVNMFDNSPLGLELKIGLLDKKGRVVKSIKKIGTDDVHPLAVAYSLYKAAEHIGRRDFTVSELYTKEFKGGPYKLFGISKDKLERILRGLQEDKEEILRVDLVADLDNIYLREDLTSLDIVKIAEVRLK